MFSPVKAVAAAALAAAIGSMLLVAQPFHQGEVVPGAGIEVVGESTGVTGTSVCSSQSGETFQGASAPYKVSDLILTCEETASDPRVTGSSTVVVSIESWGEGLKVRDPDNSATWNDYTLTGPEGTWSGHGYGFYDADGVAHLLTIATGSGAYEGLTYLQSFTVPAGTARSQTVGLIQTGAPPPDFMAASLPSAASE